MEAREPLLTTVSGHKNRLVRFWHFFFYTFEEKTTVDLHIYRKGVYDISGYIYGMVE